MRDNQKQAIPKMSVLQRNGSLGRNLLVLTSLFVMVAEILIFMPSAAAFRSNWLESRVQAARLAAIAVQVAPDRIVSDDIATQLLSTAGVKAVLLQSDGISEMILRAPSQNIPYGTVDMRVPSTPRALIDTCNTLLMPKERFLRIIDTMGPDNEGGPDNQGVIDILVSEMDLRRELLAFSLRTLISSAIISIIAAALIYGVLTFIFVRPMRNLSLSMSRFQSAPENPQNVIVPSNRRDEIGRAERDLAKLQNEIRATLSQKSHLAALGEAVAKINHDLRNILTSAQLVSDRLAGNADPGVRKMGERLVRSIDRGVSLCQSTLKFGKAEALKPHIQNVALSSILDDAFADACSGTCTVNFENGVADTVRVSVDPEHLHRMVLNLMRNAVQAMELGGKMTARADEKARTIALTFADNGPGIPEQIQANLFKPFSGSSRKDGSGLGLTIVRDLARANGGEITLVHTGKSGTVFELVLNKPKNGTAHADNNRNGV